MTTIYDAVDVGALPAGNMYLAYIDGDYITLSAVRERFPTATILTVSTSGLHSATICDVEGGDATPEVAGEGVRSGLYDTVYSALENKDAVFAACAGHPFSWFCAHPTGSPHLEADSVATQWAWPGFGSPGNYDISMTNGVWPNIPTPTPTPTPPTEDDMGISTTVMSSGQLNVFSISNGVLWHKWRITGGGWANENLGVAAGPSRSAVFPDQIPQAVYQGGHLYVTVMDNANGAWFFDQPDGVPSWGVNKLP